jgi:uncharacterized protein YaaQ
MKLVVAIVDDQDADKVMAALSSQRLGVTRVSNTGSLLSSGNSTLLSGVSEEQVPAVMKIVTDLASVRQEVVSYAANSSIPLPSLAEVQVGGFMSFVLDIDHFEQI